MLWFNFIYPQFRFCFLNCFWVKVIYDNGMTLEQNNIKFKPKIKLNQNTYT